MAENKSTLRDLVVLKLIDSLEEKEEESNGRGKKKNWIKKEKNYNITQALYKNYKWKTQMGSRGS